MDREISLKIIPADKMPEPDPEIYVPKHYSRTEFEKKFAKGDECPHPGCTLKLHHKEKHKGFLGQECDCP